MRSASHSAEAVGRNKYATTVAVKSPMEKEREEKREKERKNEMEKNGNHRLTIRFSADSWGNDRVNRKCAASNRGVLRSAEIRR